MPSSGRTSLYVAVRRAFRKARQTAPTASFPAKPRISRRGFLKTSTAAFIAASASAGRPAFAGRSMPRIAVVGAGIAGLHATYLLKQAGLPVTLYEASQSIGGRIKTNYGGLAKNLYVELGGEFIDSDHDDMLALATEFGLSLIDTQASSEDGLQVAYYADGRLYSEDEIIAAFQPLAAIVDADALQLSDSITFDSHSDFDAQLDNTNLRDYLMRNETEPWLYNILEAAYVNEYGLELKDQSSLNFVETIGTDTSDGFQVYGASDQRYKILGGNDQIVRELARRVSSQIRPGHALEALKRRTDGKYLLTFQTGHGAVYEVSADFVVLCLPFTILREIDLRLRLPTVKRRAINELGYGTNAKVILGFQKRVWRDLGYSGDSYVDLPYQSGWDSSRDQPTPFGAYTAFAGGKQGLAFGEGSEFDQARRLLPQLERVFPGTQRQWHWTMLRAFWPEDRFVKASYAAYRPGQWTQLRGAEGLTVGNLYFAGEHTSLDWQGYMNGGAESGRLAAEALTARLI